MSRSELREAGDELVAAARRVEGAVERRLHGEVVELSKLRVGDEPSAERLDDRIEAVRALAAEAGPERRRVERALAHLETARAVATRR